MDNFQKIKASKLSLSMRKLIYGRGINDAWFTVKPKINGKQKTYKPYQIWKDMLKRCYDSTYREKHPTYIGCKVCKDWLAFSVFEKWMLTQEFEGLALDKDIINQGNKIYSPATCRFISKSLNSLLVAHDAARGDLPLGVYWHKRDKVCKAQIRINGKRKHLGSFKTVQEAKSTYNSAKYAEIRRQAMMQTDPLIRDGLMNWVVE